MAMQKVFFVLYFCFSVILIAFPLLKGSWISSGSYEDVRISRFQFSFSFHVSPGQKLIRLHFYPVSYKSFRKYHDRFDVRAGPFTLLGNFSASLTADALVVKRFVKEFFIYIETTQTLKLTFSPASKQLDDAYAFVNGIEIVSMRNSLYTRYCDDLGPQLIGQKYRVFIDKSTALEKVYRLNVKEGFVSSSNSSSVLRRIRAVDPNRKSNKLKNFTWKIRADVGFGYLVRLHFDWLKLVMADGGGLEFRVLIDDKLADTKPDFREEKNWGRIHQYKDYIVMIDGQRREGGSHLHISLQSVNGLSDGPLKGFEVLKLSNSGNSLASPNPSLQSRVSSLWSFKKSILLPIIIFITPTNVVAIFIFFLLFIVVYALRHLWMNFSTVHESLLVPKTDDGQETSSDNILTGLKPRKPFCNMEKLKRQKELIFPEGPCRKFSLSDIKKATNNLDSDRVISSDGFCVMYTDWLNVSISRVKCARKDIPDIRRAIGMLSQLHHPNIAPLVGYRINEEDIFIVYEYVGGRTLLDYLYNLGGVSPLGWECRLGICLGAARGLRYLHKGEMESIIHRDLRPINIILDGKLIPKLVNFGFSKILGPMSNVEDQAIEARNIIPIDCRCSHKMTQKSDVYLFGLFMLTVLCGPNALEYQLGNHHWYLPDKVRKLNQEQALYWIIDPYLVGQPEASLKNFLNIAFNCLLDEPSDRPTMDEVVHCLELASVPQATVEYVGTSYLMPNPSSKLDYRAYTTYDAYLRRM